MNRMKRKRGVTPVYRESGYYRGLPKICTAELWLRIAALAALLLSLGLIFFGRTNSRWIEQYYSLGFYRVWSGIITAVTGLLPFSLAQWIIILFVTGCVAGLVHMFWQMAHYRRQRGGVLLRFLLRAASVASAVLLLFTANGGLNYYRSSFTAYSGLEVRQSSTEELRALCEELTASANGLRQELPEDAQGVSLQTPASAWELGRDANQGYAALLEQKPEWQPLLSAAARVRPKPVLFSEAMSYMQISGVYFPFTVEANINVHITDYNIPSTMCHELAHVAGFMREDEANFLSYLACMEAQNPFVRYSGLMLALIHSTNALYAIDPAAAVEVMAILDDGVHRDMEANDTYLARYETSFGDFATSVNNSYLKANNQTDGVRSYGRMVDLLLADYRMRHSAVQ